MIGGLAALVLAAFAGCIGGAISTAVTLAIASSTSTPLSIVANAVAGCLTGGLIAQIPAATILARLPCRRRHGYLRLCGAAAAFALPGVPLPDHVGGGGTPPLQQGTPGLAPRPGIPAPHRGLRRRVTAPVTRDGNGTGPEVRSAGDEGHYPPGSVSRGPARRAPVNGGQTWVPVRASGDASTADIRAISAGLTR
jgi:hypothetical protein